jgi:5-methylcytosine-specific restriction endonuclease McrA
MESIKNDPEKLAKVVQGRKDYRQRRNADPVRHEHWKAKHREHGKRRYAKNRASERLKAKNRHELRTPEEKREISKKLKQNRIDRRRRLVVEWGSRCQRCGYSEHPEILEFDHKVPLYRGTNGIKKRVSDAMLPEVRKHPELFELICPNCHRLKTIEEIKYLYDVVLPSRKVS